MLHSAVLEELKPSSTYFYRVGDAELGLSDVRNFTTPGALGTERPLVLGILADLGQTNDSRYIVWLFVPVCTCKSTQHGVSSRLVVVLRVRVLSIVNCTYLRACVFLHTCPALWVRARHTREMCCRAEAVTAKCVGAAATGCRTLPSHMFVLHTTRMLRCWAAPDSWSEYRLSRKSHFTGTLVYDMISKQPCTEPSVFVGFSLPRPLSGRASRIGQVELPLDSP